MGRSARSKGLKDRKYLDFIRSCPCIICMVLALAAGYEGDSSPQSSPTEAAHVGERGLSQKCSDRETIPLCAFHHREGPHAIHRIGKKFWVFFGIDKDALVEQLQDKYQEYANAA